MIGSRGSTAKLPVGPLRVLRVFRVDESLDDLLSFTLVLLVLGVFDSLSLWKE